MVQKQHSMPIAAREDLTANQSHAQEAAERVEELRRKEKSGNVIYGASYAAAAVGAIAASVMQVWKQHYSEFKNRGYFKGLRDARLKAQDVGVDKSVAGAITFTEHLADTNKIDHEFAVGFKAGLNKLGYETEGLAALFKGTWQRWKAIGLLDRGQVALTGLVATAVSFGALFTLRSNHRTKTGLDLRLAEIDHKEALINATQQTPAVTMAPASEKDTPSIGAKVDAPDHQGMVADSPAQMRAADAAQAR